MRPATRATSDSRRPPRSAQPCSRSVTPGWSGRRPAGCPATDARARGSSSPRNRTQGTTCARACRRGQRAPVARSGGHRSALGQCLLSSIGVSMTSTAAAAQEDAGADAGVPQTLHEIHDGLTFHTGALRCGWSCVVSAPRLLGAVCSARRQASRVVCPAISQSTLLGWSAEERWSSACGLEWRSVRRSSAAQPFARGRFRARCRQ